MSSQSTNSVVPGSMASGESFTGGPPILSLLAEVDTYGNDVFDQSTETIFRLPRVAQGEQLNAIEALLCNFPRDIKAMLLDVADMQKADFAALSLVWKNSAYVVGQPLKGIITRLTGMEQQIGNIRMAYWGPQGYSASSQTQAVTAERLMERLGSLMDSGDVRRNIQHFRTSHPCGGGLQLIRGHDAGVIERCKKKDLNQSERDRLVRSGAYLFWKCDSCAFRIKYFVSKSRTAPLPNNDDHVTLTPENPALKCSRAFLAMSHLEQEEGTRPSRSQALPRYTCMICVLHPPAAVPGGNHTFTSRAKYGKHIHLTHSDTAQLPVVVMQKLGIGWGNHRADGTRKELWTSGPNRIT